jgi:hypothetical protein
MAITIPVLTTFSDKGLKSAKAAFANFKTDVGNATGAMGKFKAGSNAALGAVKANAGAFALAAGTAIVGFAAKGVTAFQELALASGELADATGLSVEEASRFIEVGGLLGYEVEQVRSVIEKMNKQMGLTPQYFADARVEIARTEGGAADVSETFLNVVDRLNEIKDPAERAATASKLLGKGWTGMAEVIAMGSDKLRKSLAEVSDSQVIDKDELKKAKDFRFAMDELNDELGDMALELGESLIPALTIAVGKMADLAKYGGLFLRGAGGAVQLSREQLAEFGDKAAIAAIAAEKLGDAYREMVPNALGYVLVEANDALEEQDELVTELSEAWKILLGTLDIREQFDKLTESLDEVFTAGVKAFGGGAEELRKFNTEQKNAIETIGKLAIALDLTFGEQNRLKIFVDNGDLAAADEYLRKIQRGFGVDLGFGVGIQGARASGGSVMGGGSYLVGERGPEIFTPASSGMITPNSAIGGNTITVNVQGADPQAVVRALQDYNRTAGPIPVNTRAN